eukprot:1768232-Pyramimonas_sp.AAC.1
MRYLHLEQCVADRTRRLSWLTARARTRARWPRGRPPRSRVSDGGRRAPRPRALAWTRRRL